jgi:hypothetical protein
LEIDMKMSLIAGLVGLYLALGAASSVAQEEHDHHADELAAGEPGHGTADDQEAAKIEASLGKLGPQDRELAAAQRFCVVMTDMPLGAMGLPLKVVVNGEAVFVCCKGCQKKALADPTKTLMTAKKLRDTVQEEIEIAANMAKLSPADREVAAAQGFCAVMVDNRLGTMGPPLKISVGSEAVFLCCEGCEAKATADPNKTLAAVKKLKATVQAAAEMEAIFAKLSPADRRLAKAQGFCVVMADNPLGSMGTPIKLMVKDQPVFLCCAGCRRKALANPDQTLATVAELKTKVAASANENE